MYHNYCAETKKMRNNLGDKRIINRRMIWYLYKRTNITKQGYSLADLDRAYANFFKNDPAFPERYHDPHNPATEFIFHDMLEHMLLTANFLYGETIKSSPPFESSAAASLSYFLKTHIFKNVEYIPEAISSNMDPECFKIFDSLEDAKKELMFDLFSELSHKNDKSLPNSVKDLTFTFREFCLMLKV
jgi:hypothetical protein